MQQHQLGGVEVQAQSCGRQACENDAMAFWQSRDPKHRTMQLTDLTQLAKDIRLVASTAATSTFVASLAEYMSMCSNRGYASRLTTYQFRAAVACASRRVKAGNIPPGLAGRTPTGCWVDEVGYGGLADEEGRVDDQ